MINRKLLSLVIIVFFFILLITESYSQSITSKFRKSPTTASFNPNDPPETKIRIAPYLTFGAQIEAETLYEKNFNLDNNEDEDSFSIIPGLSLAFSFDPNRYIQAFFNIVTSGEFIFEEGSKNSDNYSLEIEQAYFLFNNLLNDSFAFQIGRQRFEDERQWLYEAELDAIRGYYLLYGITTEFSVSRGGLVDRDLLTKDVSDRINNYIVYSSYPIDEETNIGVYLIYRDDRSDENDSPIFLGIHSDGELTDSLEYWLELAYVTGGNGSNKNRGFGFDLGLTYIFDVNLEPSITLGYTFGSGDSDPDSGVDRNFRQTGLQGNESDFNGAVDFKYYGELFDPELSNMLIFTAGAGINPTEDSSIDLVYHYYLQTEESDNLRDSGIDAEPNGESKGLGSEFDIIFGFEGIADRVSSALILGYFIPGDAFGPEDDNAFLTKLIVEYQF